MIGLKFKDINRDILMIFTICYEYPMSFTNTLKLFQISKKYFWTFLEICNPMIKMGVRKAANIRKAVDKMLPYVEGRATDTSELTPKEEKIVQAFTWFLQDSFTDGISCFHVSQFESAPFVKGYTEDDVVASIDYNMLKNNLDRVSYVIIGNDKFYKTSRFLYLMEKYSGDTDARELSSLSVKEMLRRISEGEKKYYEEEAKQFTATAG